MESMSEPVRARAGVATVIDATPRSSARRSACARSAVAHRCGVVCGAWRATATPRDAKPTQSVVLEGAIWSLDGLSRRNHLRSVAARIMRALPLPRTAANALLEHVCADALSQLEAKNGFWWESIDT